MTDETSARSSKERVSDERLEQLLDFFEYRYTGRDTSTGEDAVALLKELSQRRSDETNEAPEKCGGKCPRHGPYVLLGRKGPCPICEEIKQRASEKASERPSCTDAPALIAHNNAAVQLAHDRLIRINELEAQMGLRV